MARLLHIRTRGVARRSTSSPSERPAIPQVRLRRAGTTRHLAHALVTSQVPSHVHAAAVAAGVDLLDITSSDLKTAHWKLQYQGLDFPLPSKAQIDMHASLYDESICLHPALKRPKDRPKSMKHKAGFSEKKGMKRIFTCQVCFKTGHTKKTYPNRAIAAYVQSPWGSGN